MCTRGATGTIWRGSPNVPGFYDMVKQRLEHPRIVPGISDAGAHLNIFQDGTTRKGSGAKYHLWQALLNHVPASVRHKSVNIFFIAFQPLVSDRPFVEESRLPAPAPPPSAVVPARLRRRPVRGSEWFRAEPFLRNAAPE